MLIIVDEGFTSNHQDLAQGDIRHLRCHRCHTVRARQGPLVFHHEAHWPRHRYPDGMSCGAVRIPLYPFVCNRNLTWLCSFTLNRQPGKALPYFLRLRRPNVFQLIRENNLFTDVQDQALLLVEFDQELREKRRQEGEEVDTDPVAAITLLVDHIHSIPVRATIYDVFIWRADFSAS